MSKSEAEYLKAKYRAALVKKNKTTKGQNSRNHTDTGNMIEESLGKTPRMFRRKSG